MSPTSLTALCGVLAVVAFVVVQAVTWAAPVSLCFALMAGYLPIGVLKSRVRKRQAEFAEVWPDPVGDRVVERPRIASEVGGGGLGRPLDADPGVASRPWWTVRDRRASCSTRP